MKLARFASKKLKKNGYCVAYSGQLNLPEVYRRMTEHLDYVWTCSLVHAGTHQLIQPRNVMCGWKPILIYQNGFKKMPGKSFSDIVQGTGLEKDAHRWQQAEEELIGLIDYFSNPGETILEPFAGGGTTIVASLKRGRNVLAAEIDKKAYNRAQKRLAGTEGL
jgi:site-specific DNA-methyltransferase (adenine-specific)